jgi:hypothetical protein
VFAGESKRVGVGGAKGFTSCQEELRRKERMRDVFCMSNKIKRIRKKNDWREFKNEVNKNLYRLARQPGEVCWERGVGGGVG